MFTCENCESEFFVEQTVIKLAARPNLDSRFRTVSKEKIYRLVCADCGTLAGEGVKKENVGKQQRQSAGREPGKSKGKSLDERNGRDSGTK
jgi:Fe2+ or Zn2+ uptake regulation protein